MRGRSRNLCAVMDPRRLRVTARIYLGGVFAWLKRLCFPLSWRLAQSLSTDTFADITGITDFRPFPFSASRADSIAPRRFPFSLSFRLWPILFYLGLPFHSRTPTESPTKRGISKSSLPRISTTGKRRKVIRIYRFVWIYRGCCSSPTSV